MVADMALLTVGMWAAFSLLLILSFFGRRRYRLALVWCVAFMVFAVVHYHIVIYLVSQ